MAIFIRNLQDYATAGKISEPIKPFIEAQKYYVKCSLCEWNTIFLKRALVSIQTFLANLALNHKIMLHNEFIICPECYHFINWGHGKVSLSFLRIALDQPTSFTTDVCGILKESYRK